MNRYRIAVIVGSRGASAVSWTGLFSRAARDLGAAWRYVYRPRRLIDTLDRAQGHEDPPVCTQRPARIGQKAAHRPAFFFDAEVADVPDRAIGRLDPVADDLRSDVERNARATYRLPALC